jgi:signal transduction histidine kinase
MKSIRRSLILNVFVLLALSLGAICGLVYYTTSRTLEEKKQAEQKLIELQFESRRDDALLTQAETLASVAHSQIDPERFLQVVRVQVPYTLKRMADATRYGRGPLNMGAAILGPGGAMGAWTESGKAPLPVSVATVAWGLGPLTAGTLPYAHASLGAWLRPANLWEQGSFHRALATDVQVDEMVLNRDADAAAHEYLQINTDWGSVWRSRTLENESASLDTAPLGAALKHFDDIEVTPDVSARRVIIKDSLRRFRSPPRSPPLPLYPTRQTARALIASPLSLANETPPPLYSPRQTARAAVASPLLFAIEMPRFGQARGGPAWILPPQSSRRPVEEPSDQGTLYESTLPSIYVQCAWTTNPPHPVIQELMDKRDSRLAALTEQTGNALHDLRVRLVWIGLVTLGVMLAGGWLLVGLGLMPLRRLSVAVSQISSKDFRLAVEPKELPRETLPLVDRLNQSLEQLHRAFEREKQTSADISHELRTPVAALMATLEVALRKPRAAEDYRETLEDCRAIGKQMTYLVERVLTLARLDAGTDHVEPRLCDVSPLVDGCAALGKPLAEAQGLAFRVRLEGPLDVKTDPDKLREVLMNLVHNAIEYNRPAGEVLLSARPRAAGGIVLEVKDTGIGIPSEIQDRIFERFFRADPSRNATGVHAGLGLAIVKEYVDRLGGKLTLASEVGRGSCFRIELPNL